MLVKADVAVRPIDLNATLDEAMSLLAEDAAMNGVALKAELDSRLPPVIADPIEVKQVIVNLALNAMEAMAGQPPGSGAC